MKVLSAFLLITFGLWAAPALPKANPADVGFSPERLGKITQVLKEDAAKGTMPGATLMIVRHGKIAYFESVGSLDPQKKTPMTNDAIFRIHSMRKAITTVTAGNWESGGGGMVSTASDYARFPQMMLNGGILEGKRILSPKTVAFMTSDHLGDTHFRVDPKEDMLVVYMMQSPRARQHYMAGIRNLVYSALVNPIPAK